MSTVKLSGLDILVLEDEPMLRKRVTSVLESLGAEVSAAESVEAARQLIRSIEFDVALLDVNLPDGLGTDLLRGKCFPADTVVVIMTAHGAVSGAIEAIRLGATDYLIKPFEADELPLVLERARRSRQSARVEEHRRSDACHTGFFFGTALAALENQLNRILVADQRLEGALPPILIQGETGTGKTAIARWLHQHGPRSGRELVEVNCSALPETLAESELFGHERGAFTDARTARMGLFEAANSGTLFLDELPTLSLSLQAKVLTAIEDGKIRRVGGNKSIPVNARIIAATQRDLKELVDSGTVREDLYHRLDLYRVRIPPLRERGEDIVRLTDFFLRDLCKKHRQPLKRVSETGRERLLAYHWPGNVRELSHELERALVFEETEELGFANLPGSLSCTVPLGSSPGLDDWLMPGYRLPEKGFFLEKAMNRFIHLALDQTEGNVSAAARLLGVPRDFVRYRLNQKNLKPDGN